MNVWDAEDNAVYWDVTIGRDKLLYATYQNNGVNSKSGVACFNLATATGPLTLKDATWKIEVDSSLAHTLTYYFAADGVPDRLGDSVIVAGIVTSLNFSTSGYLATIQDASAGIHLWDYGNSTSNYNIGDRVQVSGEVAQYKGLVTLADLQANPEMYESKLIKVNAIMSTSDWPAEGKNANLKMTDGYLETTFRVDKETDIDGQAEPVWPANVIAVGGQYTSATPPLDGYQVLPRMYNDIEPDVAAPPSPYFFFTDETKTEYDGKTIQISTTDQEFTFAWNAAVDLNGDNLIYQMQMIVEGTPVEFNAADTFVTVTGQQIIDALGSSKDAKITVRTKGAESALVSSVDTLSVTFSNVVGVDEENMIPKEFYVDQNYPNPFNPTTTIKFGLPVQAEVNLIIYDILGREVSRIISSQVMNAGNYNYSFDASNLSSGTYIYRLQADQKVEIKKMLLLK